MNIQTFRNDLLSYLEATKTKTHALSRAARVDAGSMYRFLSGETALSAESVFKLWPFLYHEPQRAAVRPLREMLITPTAPATRPSLDEVGGDAA